MTHHIPDPDLRQAERRARLLQAANQVGKQVASILDLDKLLPKTVDILCEAYGFYYAGIFLVDETGQWAVLRAGRGAAGAVMLAQGHRLAIGPDSMVGWAITHRQARIALDVGDERVHFKNPLLPHTRSEMALPLVMGEKALGAVSVQSTEERAFSEEDILTLQTMADHLAVAIHNARLLQELKAAQAEILRAKTFEALTAATTQAIHWIGNKALPISTTVARLKTDLTQNLLDRDSLLEDVALIEENIRLILEVKENLLGPAREAPPRPCLLADVVQAAAFLAGVPAAQIKYNLAPRTPLALADTTHLARALGYLFRNALEAEANHLTVRIAPASEPGFVALEITDNGAGIPPDLQDRVWAAFVSTKPGHTGLGLTACSLVINQLQGRISAVSQPGAGTTFRILLPAATQPAGGLEPNGGLQDIVIIDDENPWVTFALSTLKAAGKNVVHFPQHSVKIPPQADLIWVDEAFEAAHIVEVLSDLKAAGVICRVVVLSAAPTVEATTVYLNLGARNVALKPYTPAEFIPLLEGET
jgi:signal transduction histidine kinase